MRELSLPPSDEPFDFRRQAATYARYRRDYSSALYDTIETRTGRAADRAALDLACGTGFVAGTLALRGWRTVGVDFSPPMLAEARRRADGRVALVNARAEAVALRDASVALVTCGTAFHWLAPAPALAEIERVLVPGGWVAVFWRYDAPGQPYMRLVGELLQSVAGDVPVLGDGFTVHPLEPFAGSRLVPVPPLVLHGELAFTPESFHGYVGTLEWVRRFAGDAHAAVMDRLREELPRRWPDGFRERVVEHLFLARRAG
ncbi:MAG TPA: class I SAM-dependent methyltransferase [Candidatus Binatia bacterium]|nr:class I SAM-dependent methyltransferase [Candidatus Binatia bacterium]